VSPYLKELNTRGFVFSIVCCVCGWAHDIDALKGRKVPTLESAEGLEGPPGLEPEPAAAAEAASSSTDVPQISKAPHQSAAQLLKEAKAEKSQMFGQCRNYFVIATRYLLNADLKCQSRIVLDFSTPSQTEYADSKKEHISPEASRNYYADAAERGSSKWVKSLPIW
jgi:hypothetical protein